MGNEIKNGVTLIGDVQAYLRTAPSSRAVYRAGVVAAGEGVELGGETVVLEYDHQLQQFTPVTNIGEGEYLIRLDDLPAIARLALGRTVPDER